MTSLIACGIVAIDVGGASIALSNAAIDENSSVGTTLGTASLTGTYTGTPVWSLTDDASGTFAIDSSTGEITVADNTALDFETNPTLSITISVSGVTPSVSDDVVTVTVNNVDEGTIALSANAAVQGATQGTDIGTVSGGTGPYSVTDATNQTQMNVDGVTLEVGSVAPSVGANAIVLHDTGTPAAPDGNFTINTVPQAPVLDLISASDTGSSSTDNVTSNNTPTIDFSFPTTPLAGDKIEVRDGASTIVTHTITSGEISGSTVDFALSALSDGVHSLTARHIRTLSAIDYTSAWSSALAITVDTTAPSLTSATGAQNGTTQTDADLSVSTNDGTGTLYWIISTSVTPPSVAQIQAGNDSSGSAAAKSGSASVSATGVQSVTAHTMSAGTYYAYFQQKDTAGNNSTVSGSTSWTQTLTFSERDTVAGKSFVAMTSPGGRQANYSDAYVVEN